MYLKLAWRNVWRNRRRSLITIASIFFAVLFANLMQSLQQGMWEKALSTTMSLSGYIQVQDTAFWDEPILDNGLVVNDSLVDQLQGLPNISNVTQRIQSGALVAHDSLSKFSLLYALVPSDEVHILELDKKLDSGSLISDEDEGILIGAGMARYFDIGVGDTLSLIGQGYHGASANGNFPIRGVIRYGTEQMSSSLVVMPLKLAQRHMSAPGVVTSLNVYPHNIDKLESTKQALGQVISDDHIRLMTWKEMMPELVQAFQADTGGNVIFLMVLYLIIGFGIFGTVLMMTAERMYEFGVLVSVGMKRFRLSIILFLETILLSFLGILAGSLASFPVMYYYNQNPIPMTGGAAESMKEYGFEAIIQGSISPDIFIADAGVVLLIVFLVNIYPALVISKLNPVKAMRK